MGSIPVLEPDVASLVSSPGVGVRTPPYIPAYNHTESNHTITKTSKSSVGTPVNEEKCVSQKMITACLSVLPLEYKHLKGQLDPVVSNEK